MRRAIYYVPIGSLVACCFIFNLVRCFENAFAGDVPLYAKRSRISEKTQLTASPAFKQAAAQGAPVIHQFLEGIDVADRPMAADEIAKELNDPFAALVLRKGGSLPGTLGQALQALDAQKAAPNGVPDQKSFVIAEDGQIPWTKETNGLQRNLRFTVIRSRGTNADVMISANPQPDGFLQLLAWDEGKHAFNFYERIGGPAWVWRGDSEGAMRETTRGKGCFMCHVNGHPNMKELNFPWNNWNSMVAPVADTAVPPGSPVLADPLFKNKLGAETLETSVIRPAILRLQGARFGRPVADWNAARPLLRHLFETTTVNLATSSDASRAASPGVALPLSFFLNKSVLFDAIGVDAPGDFQGLDVARTTYQANLQKDGFALVSGMFRQPGDTFFGFIVPEPSFEDVSAIGSLISHHLITPKFAACVVMIDFPNPVFSPLRQNLLKYVPAAGPVEGELSAPIAEAIVRAAANLPDSSAEAQFAANWKIPDDQWKNVFAARIGGYLAAVKAKAVVPGNFDRYVELAESRRRQFALLPLNEFELLLPETQIPRGPVLKMSPDGTVGPR